VMKHGHHQAQREQARDPSHGAQNTRATRLLTMHVGARIFTK
jgi:hypothetical protein